MTYPVGPPPDGAYVVGDPMGQGMTEESVRQAVKTPTVDAWSLAQGAWGQRHRESFDAAADLEDGQNAYRDRLDLLANSSGHGSVVMGRNWLVPSRRWVNVPFATQIGPMKRSAVDASAGVLRLRAGGLWRVDAFASYRGFEEFWTPSTSDGTTTTPDQYDYSHPGASFRIEVLSSAGALLTARTFNDRPPTARYTEQYWPDRTKTVTASVHFSHTFVLDSMTGESADAGSPSQYASVRLSMYSNALSSVGTRYTECTIYGGTKLSGLTASRWSHDSTNNVSADTVPDGGTL